MSARHVARQHLARAEDIRGGRYEPRLTGASRITPHELVIRPEAEDWIVGRVELQEFVAMPELGVRAIRLLSDGHTVAETRQYLESEDDDAIEVLSFVEQLRDLGFLKAIDGIVLDGEPGDDIASSLPWIRPRHVGWLFSGPLLAVYAATCAAALVIVGIRPRLLPRYGDLLISRSTTTVVVADTALTLALMGLHELAHLLAARSVGVPGRISWGTRLFDLVAQTSMPGVWAVSRRERMRCYLAGMAFEAVLASAVIIVLAAANLHGAVGRTGSAIVALILLGFLMELLVFKRTDVYFVVADLVGARNLHDDACRYLLTHLRALVSPARRGRAVSASSAQPEPMDRREYRLVRGYAWFMVAGSAASAAALAAYIVPAIATLFARSRAELVSGISHQDYFAAAAAATSMTILCGSWILFLVVFVRSRGTWWRRLHGTG
jgi:putative peptide zinc metalloprotease protein